MVAPHAGNGRHCSEDAAQAARSRMHTPHTPEGPHPLEPLLAHLTQLQTHVSHYLQATADKLRLSVRQAAVWAALGLVAAVVGATVLVTATVLLLSGAANGIAASLGGRLWAGQLIVGSLVLIGTALAGWLGLRSLTASSRRKTIDKYERQHYAHSAEHRTGV
jgi:hypothetical protein